MRRPAMKPGMMADGFAMVLASLLISAVVGAVVVPYGAWVGDNLIRMAALPGVLALLLLFVLDKSKLFLLIILIRAPIDPLLYETVRLGPMTVGAVLNALVLLIGLLLFIERPRAVSRVVIPMWLPLVLILLFETARAPELFSGIRNMMSSLTYVAVFMVPFYLRQCQKDLRFCIGLILLSSLIPAFYGFVGYALEWSDAMWDGRLRSTFSHPNIFGYYLVVVISLAFYMLKSPRMKTSLSQRWLLTAYMGALMILLVLTKGRTAWAGCLVMFLVYGLMFERKYLIYIAVVSGLALLIPAVQDRLLDLDSGRIYWNYGWPLNSYEWRKLMWESAWAWMKLSALPLGYGLGSFDYYTPEFFQFAGGSRWGAHSVYLEWLFEAGIVGVLCAAWLYWRLLSLLRMGMNDDKFGTVIVIAVVIEYLVVSYADNMLDYLPFNWYYWFLLGTACSIIVTRQAQTPVQARESGSFPDSAGRVAPQH